MDGDKQYVQMPDGSYRAFDANASDDEINRQLGGETKNIPVSESYWDKAKRYGNKAIEAISAAPKPETQEQAEKWYGFTPEHLLRQGARGVGEVISGIEHLGRLPTSTQQFKEEFVDPYERLAEKYLHAPTTTEKAGYMGGMLLPVVGPAAVSVGEQMGSRDIGGGLARGAGMALGGEVLGAGEAETPREAAPETLRPAEPRSARVAEPPVPPPVGEALERRTRLTPEEQRFDEVARRMFGKPYDALLPEQKVVVARNVSGYGGPERRIVRGEGPTMERRAEEMPLPQRTAVPGTIPPTQPEIARPGPPVRGGGPPEAPLPTTLPSTRGEVPPATLDDILRRATGQEPPARLEPRVPLGEQLKKGPGAEGAASAEQEQDPIKVKYPDPAVRRFVRANGEGVVGATEGNPEALQAIHDLKNWEVRQAAIRAGIDVGQQHVGSRQNLGPAQVSRQALLDQMIQRGVKPEDIPRLARPETQAIGRENLKQGDTFVDDKGEPRRIVEITQKGIIKTADGTARDYQGSIDAQGALNSPRAQLARGGKFIPYVPGSTVPLREQPQPMKGSPSSLDVAMELSKRTRGAGLPKLVYGRATPEAQVARATAILADEARFQLAQNKTGGQFYTDEMAEHDRLAPELRRELGDKATLSIFKWVEAITSTLAKPYQNIGMAKRVWDTYENGKFSKWNPASEQKIPITPRNSNLEMFDKVKVGPEQYKRVVGKSRGNWIVASSWGPMGIDGYGNALDTLSQLIKDKGGHAGASQWLLERHPTSELRQYNPNVPGEATDMQRGALVFGDKRGPFGLNLHGIDDEFTGDRWVARTWNRMMGTAEINNQGGLVDAPRNPGERALMKESFASAASELKLSISEMQAVQWRYEQELWSAMGAARETGSFAQAMQRHIAEETGAKAAPSGKQMRTVNVPVSRKLASPGASRAGPR